MLDIGGIVKLLASGEIQRRGPEEQAAFADMIKTMIPRVDPTVGVEPKANPLRTQGSPRIYYHVTNLLHFQELAREQIGLMYTSGLLAQSQLYINLHYSVADYVEFRAEWEQHPLADRIHWVYAPGGPLEREHTTARLMHVHALGSSESYPALYVHQKGISYRGLEREFVTQDWQRFMDYWTIHQWRDCVSALKDPEVDTAGCNWREYPFPHYSGNQYWVKSDFLRTCIPLKLPREVNYASQTEHVSPYTDDYKFDVEAWVGHCGARSYNLWESGRDHYWQPYPPQEYLLRVSKSNVDPKQV